MPHSRPASQILTLAVLPLLLCMIFIMSSGCGHSSDSQWEDPSNLREQWVSPYQFDAMVVPTDGSPGILSDYAIELTFETDEGSLQLRCDAANHGRGEVDVQVKRVSTGPDGEVVTDATFKLDCYELHHHITVLMNNNWGQSLPVWADVTLWIPTGKPVDSGGPYGVCVKAAYEDSSETSGLWSWCGNTTVFDSGTEQNAGGTVRYEPYTSGEFAGFDNYVIFPIYGVPWKAFATYSAGGEDYFELIDTTTGEGSRILYENRCERIIRLIGGCEFTTWQLYHWSALTTDSTCETGAAFTSDMPLPFYYYVKIMEAGSVKTNITWSMVSLSLRDD